MFLCFFFVVVFLKKIEFDNSHELSQANKLHEKIYTALYELGIQINIPYFSTKTFREYSLGMTDKTSSKWKQQKSRSVQPCSLIWVLCVYQYILLGPVVQSVVSLTSSLRVISLTVLADSIYNILIFFAEKM